MGILTDDLMCHGIVDDLAQCVEDFLNSSHAYGDIGLEFCDAGFKMLGDLAMAACKLSHGSLDRVDVVKYEARLCLLVGCKVLLIVFAAGARSAGSLLRSTAAQLEVLFGLQGILCKEANLFWREPICTL